MLTAEQIMNKQLVAIRPEASVKDAIEMLLAEQISGLPVLDAEGHLIGVITEFAMLATAYDHDVKDETVEQHMTREVITVEVDAPIGRVADLCIIHRVRRLPVVRDGHLVGLISRRDVLKALFHGEQAVCTT